MAARDRSRDDGARDARADPRPTPACCRPTLGSGGARDRGGRRVLADRRDLDLPDRRLRRRPPRCPALRLRRRCRARSRASRCAHARRGCRACSRTTVHTTGQAAVRLSVLLLAALILLTRAVGFDYVLGAFAAGLVTGLALDSPEGKEVQIRLEGIGFGFLIPIYFVVTGMMFDIDGLLTRGLGPVCLFLALIFVVRGASALLWLRELAPARRRGSPSSEPPSWRSSSRSSPSAPAATRSRARRRGADRRRDDLGARVPDRRDSHRRRGSRAGPARERRGVLTDSRRREAPKREGHPRSTVCASDSGC